MRDEAHASGRSRQELEELRAAQAVAERRGLRLIGWGPSSTPFNDPRGYGAEYGLDNPQVASPYAAALMTIADPATDSAAAESLGLMLGASGEKGSVPDAFDAKYGTVANPRTLSLSQNLLFLAVNHHHVRAMVAESEWYAQAASMLQQTDKDTQPRP